MELQSQIKDILNNIHPISADSFSRFFNIIEHESFGKNEDIIRKNKINRKEYLIIKGGCRTFVHSPKGDEITISFYLKGSMITPSPMRNARGVSNVNVRTLIDTEVVSFDMLEFEQLMFEQLDIRQLGNAVLYNELKMKVDKEIGLASMTAKERLIDFRKKYAELENLIPHSDISSYLGITNTSFSRLRKEIQRS